ncbi:unnamed protein product [Diabrotica balteata]|uniref:Reverse transcriptase domain-containing protein n=1 Tax=Diabrotica balteata TaxID=107213 RepID=A0A9N9TB68_DIABA|nr:unnamed protein product [Diabrotica balteata]
MRSTLMQDLVTLLNQIYSSGVLPKEWLTRIFICIAKKKKVRECSDYCTISLMFHMLKLLLKVIHNRINHKLDIYVNDTQLGFRKGLGTREHLFFFT